MTKIGAIVAGAITAIVVLQCSSHAAPAGWDTGTVVAITNCSVVIAGGSTAALAAAIASAKEGVRTCLLEPTE